MPDVIDIPRDPQVGCVLPIRYIVQNTGLELVDLNIQVDSNDTFVFAGSKTSQVRLLPLGTQVLPFHFVPVVSGKCMLPVFKVLKEEKERSDVEFLMSHHHGPVAPGNMSIFVKPLLGW